MQRSYEKWYSPALGREMELLHFGWSGFPVILFPTSQGRFFQYEDTGLVGRLAPKLDRGEMQLVCVDSVDSESWYNEAQRSRCLRLQFRRLSRRELCGSASGPRNEVR